VGGVRRAVLAAVVFGALVCAPGAGAVTLVTPDGQVAQPYQQWVTGLRVPTVQEVVVVHAPSVCPAYPDDPRVAGCAYRAANGDMAAIYLRYPSGFTLRHELGHLFAFSIGVPSTEGFANGYADCAEGRPGARCAAIRRAGGWVMAPAYSGVTRPRGV
jgi:hypothetical protein